MTSRDKPRQARDEFESTRPRLNVTIRLHSSELETLRRAVDWSVRPSVGAGRPAAGEERVELILQFERLEFAFAELIKLAGAVEVVAPRELRQRLADPDALSWRPTLSRRLGRFKPRLRSASASVAAAKLSATQASGAQLNRLVRARLLQTDPSGRAPAAADGCGRSAAA